MKKTNESGRSMVEMLGVLAIIGVLSIGGIAGYTLAMNRYRANEIVNAAAEVAIVAMTKNGGIGGDADLSDLGGIETVTVPAVPQQNDSITSTNNGIVTITFAEGFDEVAKTVNSLSGTRVVSGCTGTGACKLNMQAAVRRATPASGS